MFQVVHQLQAQPRLNQELLPIFKLVNVRLKTEEYVVILKTEQTTSTGLETMGAPRLQTLVPQQITLMEPGEVSSLIVYSTVVPTKSDSDIIFCLQLLSKTLTCKLHLSYAN